MVNNATNKKKRTSKTGSNYRHNNRNKQKQKEDHNIVLAMDGNEPFLNDKGGITRICRECKLFDQLHHRHGNQCDSKSFLDESHRIDFFFCSLNI